MGAAQVEPVRQGDRGAAVEDVQRRLLVLGYDLGPSGVDGVFLGATLAAVRSFQRGRALREEGFVGQETWSALVDATFTLGDRLLYLRVPYFHGCDVRTLQGALNALGFSCGEPDGIFGAYTERAVREFQANTGQPADGIVGGETVRALVNLKHVWADKGPKAPVDLTVAPARAGVALCRTRTAIVFRDALTEDVAGRLSNLMLASEPASYVVTVAATAEVPGDADLLLRLAAAGPPDPSVPTVAHSSEYADTLAARLLTAMNSIEGRPATIDVALDAGQAGDERARQRVAVELLDGLCGALAQYLPLVIP